MEKEQVDRVVAAIDRNTPAQHATSDMVNLVAIWLFLLVVVQTCSGSGT